MSSGQLIPLVVSGPWTKKRHTNEPYIVCETRSILSSRSFHGQHTSKLCSSLRVFFCHETIPLLKVVWVKHSSNHFELTRTCESHTVMIRHGQLQRVLRRNSSLDTSGRSRVQAPNHAGCTGDASVEDARDMKF